MHNKCVRNRSGLENSSLNNLHLCVLFLWSGYMENKYIEEILKLSQKAIKKGSVPVGAIVVKNTKIISRGYNKKEKTHNPLDHAEIIAIRKATKKIKSWNLNGCSLYVTMSPCKMCRTIINEARIENVYYLVDNEKEKYKNKIGLKNIKKSKINNEKAENQYLIILRDFFQQKRKKSRKIIHNVL